MMHLSFAGPLALLLLVNNMPFAYCDENFRITSLRSTSPAFLSSASQRFSITFTVQDPSPTTSLSATCTASWHRVFEGNPPSSWVNPPTKFTICTGDERHDDTFQLNDPAQKIVGTKSRSETLDPEPEFWFRVGDGGLGSMPSFENASSFGLDIVNSFHNTKAAKPSHERRESFARLAINETSLDCRVDSLGSRICELKDGLVLEAPVYGVV